MRRVERVPGRIASSLAAARKRAYCLAVPAHNQPIAVVLDLMHRPTGGLRARAGLQGVANPSVRMRWSSMAAQIAADGGQWSCHNAAEQPEAAILMSNSRYWRKRLERLRHQAAETPNPQFQNASMADFELRPDQVWMRFDQLPDRLFHVVETEPLSERAAPCGVRPKLPGGEGDRRRVRQAVGQNFDEALQPGRCREPCLARVDRRARPCSEWP